MRTSGAPTIFRHSVNHPLKLILVVHLEQILLGSLDSPAQMDELIHQNSIHLIWRLDNILFHNCGLDGYLWVRLLELLLIHKRCVNSVVIAYRVVLKGRLPLGFRGGH